MTDSRSNNGSVASRIHSLPTELLVRIFQYAIDLETRIRSAAISLRHPQGINYYTDLSSLRLACKRWNIIIEADPKFWFCIFNIFPPRLLRKVTGRATGSKQFFAHYEHGTRYQRRFQLDILPFSELWTTLAVEDAPSDELLQILSRPAPRLRQLHISGVTLPPAELENAFRGIQLELEVLRVHSSVFPWNLIAIKNLVELGFDVSVPYTLFPQGFLDLIRFSPTLKSIRLREPERPDPRSRLELEPASLHLPKLSTVDLGISGPVGLNLLQAIVSPPPTKVSFIATEETPSMRSPWVLAAVNHTNFKCSSCVSVKLKPSHVSIEIGSIDLHFQPHPHPPYQLAPTLQFCLDFIKPFSDTNGSAVTTLQLESVMTWNIGSFIRDLDAWFPNVTDFELRFIWFDTRYSPNTFDSLSRPIVEEDGRRRWLLRKVENLTVHCLNPEYLKTSPAESFMQTIRSRRLLHPAREPTSQDDRDVPPPARLRHVRLEGCRLEKSTVEELKDLFRGHHFIDLEQTRGYVVASEASC